MKTTTRAPSGSAVNAVKAKKQEQQHVEEAYLFAAANSSVRSEVSSPPSSGSALNVRQLGPSKHADTPDTECLAGDRSPSSTGSITPPDNTSFTSIEQVGAVSPPDVLRTKLETAITSAAKQFGSAMESADSHYLAGKAKSNEKLDTALAKAKEVWDEGVKIARARKGYDEANGPRVGTYNRHGEEKNPDIYISDNGLYAPQPTSYTDKFSRVANQYKIACNDAEKTCKKENKTLDSIYAGNIINATSDFRNNIRKITESPEMASLPIDTQNLLKTKINELEESVHSQANSRLEDFLGVTLDLLFSTIKQKPS